MWKSFQHCSGAFVIVRGYDVNAADRYDCTVLYYACGNDDNEEILHMLIDAGADLINEGRRHLLHECVERSAMNNLGILLNRYSVDLYLKKLYGQMALHEAVRMHNWMLCRYCCNAMMIVI